MEEEPVKVWIGCTSRHFLKETIHSLERLIRSLGRRMEILDDNETCCGSVLFTTGQNNEALINLKEVEKLLSEKSVNELVSICPGCTRTFREQYVPLASNPLNFALHISELLVKELDNLNLKNEHSYLVTYHDPCHLGRHMEIFEEPRKVIEAIPGVTLKEMRHTRNESFCCGSGGGVRAYNKDLANNASALRIMEAKSTGADFLITACPFCERSFKSAQSLGEELSSIEVINLVDFVARFVE